MAGWFDVGVNLTSPRLADPEVLTRARDAGVSHMAVTGTSVEESARALELCRSKGTGLYATAGVHPHYASDVDGQYLNQLRHLASHDSVIAIGECGLDFNRNFSAPADQLNVFEQQLGLACELGLPVFLHERDAFEQQIALLSRYRSQLVGGVAHCFTGTLEQMQAYLDLDLYIGITGWVCDSKRGAALREAVPHLPLNRIVLETDAPYLFPKTLKVKQRTNEPAYLPHIAEQVCLLMGVDSETLRRHSVQNSMGLFRLGAEEGA